MYGRRRLFTPEEFIKYRNIVRKRAEARRKAFPEDPPSYWELRLREIEDLYPEFNAFGQIRLKNAVD